MKRISFFNWSLMLVVLVSGLVVTGCSEDEEEDFFDKTLILGSWSNKTIQKEGETSVTMEVTYSFYSNGKASQRVLATMSYGTLIKDYVIEDVTNNYTYTYNKKSTITFTNQKNETWVYEVSVYGNKMRLGNEEDGYWDLTKKSSASSELPSDEPKEEVELKLDYTFAESGDMTRATGSEVYSTFYEKYIKTKVLTPRNYTLTFNDKVTGSSVATFKGSWESKDGVRLPEGEYIVTGTSSPIFKDIVHASDSVYISFQDTVRITKDMTTLVLKANYNAYLLMFDAKDVRDIFYSYGNGGKIPLVKTNEDIYYLFIESLVYTNYANYINLYRNSGAVNRIMLESIPFSKGKYYYFNDMTNSFDIPMMESGN